MIVVTVEPSIVDAPTMVDGTVLTLLLLLPLLGELVVWLSMAAINFKG